MQWRQSMASTKIYKRQFILFILLFLLLIHFINFTKTQPVITKVKHTHAYTVTRPCKAIQGHTRTYKAIQGHTRHIYAIADFSKNRNNFDMKCHCGSIHLSL